jgi:hypothetical protein
MECFICHKWFILSFNHHFSMCTHGNKLASQFLSTHTFEYKMTKVMNMHQLKHIINYTSTFSHQSKEGFTSKLKQHKVKKALKNIFYCCHWVHIHVNKNTMLTTLWMDYKNTWFINLTTPQLDFFGCVFDLKLWWIDP